MQIKTDHLSMGEALVVDIKGDEEWLKELYLAFPSAKEKEAPILVGRLEVTLWEDFLRLEGRYSYSPYVSCGRCDLGIQWPIEGVLDINYSLSSPSEYAREKELSSEELDEYYLENGTLDLEAALNESVQLSLPAVVKPLENSDGSCSVCGKDTSETLVFSVKSKSETKAPQPFAELAKLKILK